MRVTNRHAYTSARPYGTSSRNLLQLVLVLLLGFLAAGCNRSLDDSSALPPAGEPEVIAVAPAEAADANATAEAVPAAGAEAEPTATAAAVSATDETDNDEAAPGEASEPPSTPEATATALPEPTPTPDIAAGRVVLWHSYAGPDADALGEILAEIRRTYPDLVVETLFVAYDDLPQAYADAVLAGGGPDLVAAPAWWLTQMVDAGVVQALDALVVPELADEYFPAALEALRRNNALYGLPVTYELVSLFANQALTGTASPPATTAELLARGQEDPRQGTGIYANLFHLAWGLPAYGATLLDGDGVAVLDQGEGAAGFLGWLETLDNEAGAYVEQDYGMLLDRFKKGEFAYFIDGPWAINELRGVLGDSLTVMPLPAGPAAPAQPWLSADAMLINPAKSADQQQRALLVAQKLTDGAAGAAWAGTAQRLSANRNAPAVGDPLLKGFAVQAESAQPIPHAPEMDQVWGYAGDMLIKVLNDVMTPAEAAIEAAALINEANDK